MTRLCYYKNRTARGQVINTNTGRSLHVSSRCEERLVPGEEGSVEIQAKLRGIPPAGELRYETLSEAPPVQPISWKPSLVQQVEPEPVSTPMEQETKEETSPARSRRKR